MITLRKDKGDRLSIKELDDNFEYLAMQSNDIDLYWDGVNYRDFVDDTLYIKDINSGLYYLKSFITQVDRLGIRIKNWDLIKNDNPEIIIEKFKKRKKKTTVYTPTKYKVTYPYNNDIYSAELYNITGNGVITRPMIIPLTAESAYYRLYAENYFSPINPPKVSGSANSFYIGSAVTYTQFDDTDQYSKELPVNQKGTAYCRISIRISDGMGGQLLRLEAQSFQENCHHYCVKLLI
jgi:hypothetical protein